MAKPVHHRTRWPLASLAGLALAALACQAVFPATPTPQPTPTPAPSATVVPTATALPTETLIPTKPPAPTDTPTPEMVSANSTPLPNGLTLSNAQETRRDLAKTMFLVEMAAENYTDAEWNKIDGQLNFTLQISDSDQRLVWSDNWCATTSAALAENLAKMQVAFSLNGRPVDMTTLMQGDYQDSRGLACHGYWAVVSGWPAETTTLETKTTLTAPLNDGLSDYAAGYFLRTYTVTRAAAQGPTTAASRDLSFQYDSALATGINVSRVPGEGAVDSQTPHPVASLYAFKGYPVGDATTFPQPELMTFSAPAYAQIWRSNAANIEELKAIFEAGTVARGGLPYFPCCAAAQIITARAHIVPFSGGKGIAYLMQYGQTETAITNQGLFYMFAGLTDDGQRLIAATFPVHAAGLPATFDSVPAEVQAQVSADFAAYIRGVEKQLAGLKPDDFTPSLTALDQVLGSLTMTGSAVQPAATAQPAGTAAPLPSGLVLGSSSATRQALGYQVTYLEDQADGFSPADQNLVDKYFGVSRQFNLHVSGKQPLMWANGWCAANEIWLAQNLKSLQFEMRVNDQPVKLGPTLITEDLSLTGDYCRMYRVIVSGWPAGKTTLVSKVSLNEPISNGNKDYPVGDFTRTYVVNNP